MTTRPRVLITGAAGFVGRHTVEAFNHIGYRVSAVDVRPSPDRPAYSAHWFRRNFADPSLLAEIADGRFRTVIHQAANSDTRAEATGELEETNTLGPLRLAEACHAGGARLIYASSHAVYGTLRHRVPIAEDADCDPGRCSGPLNPYAASKLALDQQMRNRYGIGLEWIGLRYTNVFGADETDKGSMASILSQLVRQTAHTGRIRVFDDSLTAARDYIPVEAVVETIVRLAETELPVPPRVYNLGAGFAVSFAEIAQWCARLYRRATALPLHVELVSNPIAAAYQYYTCADMSALDQVLPDRPTVSRTCMEARVDELFEDFHRHTTA